MSKVDLLMEAHEASVEREEAIESSYRASPVLKSELVAIEIGVRRGLVMALAIELDVTEQTVRESIAEELL